MPIRSTLPGRARSALPAALLCVIATGCAAAASAPTPAPAPEPGPAEAAAAATVAPAPVARTLDSTLAAVTFDSVWRRVRDSYYDPAMRGVDWTGVRDELRPHAIGAPTGDSLRVVLQGMVDRLGESHFSIIPGSLATEMAGTAADPAPDGARPGDLGLTLRLVDDRMTVVRLDPAGPAAAAGVRTGWTVELIEADSIAPGLRSLAGAADEAARRELRLRLPLIAMARLEGAAGSPVRVTFGDASGLPTARNLVRRPAPGQIVRFGNLPPTLASVTHRRLPDADGCVGYVAFNSWMVPLMPAIETAMDAVRDCRGIVVDLRGNLGGVAGMVMGVAGHLVADPVPLGVFRTRTGEARFVVNPRRVTSAGVATAPYAGPVALLIDGQSASTSEFFAAGLQYLGRARLFGQTTAGKALPASLIRLPTGDAFMHVVADFTVPDGTRLEGVGVQPDVLVPLERGALLAGRDAPLEAALAWIRTGGATGVRP